MSQGTIVVGALLAGFVLYLATNNRLATYWAILIGRSAPSGGGTLSAAQGVSPSAGMTTAPPTSLTLPGLPGGPGA